MRKKLKKLESFTTIDCNLLQQDILGKGTDTATWKTVTTEAYVRVPGIFYDDWALAKDIKTIDPDNPDPSGLPKPQYG